ncbi:CoA-disulfide reductase [Entomospira culicis]|uniref:CoA-disulfide reductase n=1 Tax=Entomospira culicis TaxID=2719989 RepID=A0A968KVE1_9SPIO|nr:CoA-disulfide reductase [Entomospira culicis]NIZ18793.1 CoA-disulfide reductase [Entomospira culicis]NIZ69008.1 CoA-disulfide reductase [Entomospira culicis]WDI37598.1 CoA-disulfide reductase [Entomospira culicis]WDI39226.1 CoA-disulfide reductase [Entomospira culicis]
MKIIVVGATAAGTTFAAKMRRNKKDAQIILLEKSNTTSLGACGLPFYVGGFFDNPHHMIARTPEQFVESGIDTRILHEALSVNAKDKSILIKDLAKNQEYSESYDALVIATGASVAPMPFSLAEGVDIYPLRRLEDGIRLHEALHSSTPKHVAIIGAGFIGIEVVEGALKLGHQVSLIDGAPKPMANSVDEEFQNLIDEELNAHNVKGYYGSFIKAIDQNKSIILENGQRISADIIVWAGGIVPATMWLEPSGIAMERGVIQTDRNGETSLTDIYAIGDCATVHHLVLDKPFYSPLATTANKMGRFLADHLAGVATGDFTGMMGSASLKACDLEVVRVGLSEGEAKRHGVSYQSAFIEDKDHTNYYPDAQKIWIKLLYDDTGVILGAQLAGKRGAALRGSAMAFAVAKRMTIKELGLLDIPYSPPFARTWDALNVAGNASKLK